jgi:hypothetical protein
MSNREKFDAENEAKRRVRLYMDGFRCGVTVGIISPEETVDPLFSLGWKAGRDACQEAYRRSCAFHNLEPTHITVNGV